MARLELARSRPHASQACAYTNSATSAESTFAIITALKKESQGKFELKIFDEDFIYLKPTINLLFDDCKLMFESKELLLYFFTID